MSTSLKSCLQDLVRGSSSKPRIHGRHIFRPEHQPTASYSRKGKQPEGQDGYIIAASQRNLLSSGNAWTGTAPGWDPQGALPSHTATAQPQHAMLNYPGPLFDSYNLNLGPSQGVDDGPNPMNLIDLESRWTEPCLAAPSGSQWPLIERPPSSYPPELLDLSSRDCSGGRAGESDGLAENESHGGS